MFRYPTSEILTLIQENECLVRFNPGHRRVLLLQGPTECIHAKQWGGADVLSQQLLVRILISQQWEMSLKLIMQILTNVLGIKSFRKWDDIGDLPEKLKQIHGNIGQCIHQLRKWSKALFTSCLSLQTYTLGLLLPYRSNRNLRCMPPLTLTETGILFFFFF